MKTSAVIAVAAALTVVNAQGLDTLPPCALTCALSSIGTTGCGQTDVACICQATAFIANLMPCVLAGCSAAELETTIVGATALCLSAGVTLSVPAIPSGTATAAPSASESVSAPVESTTEIVVEPPVTNATTTASEDLTPKPTGNATTTGADEDETAPPSATPTGNTASRNAIALGGLGAIVAFVAALL